MIATDWRNVRAGKESRLAAVQLDAVRGIKGDQTIEILIVADAFLDRRLLGVGRCVGDTRAQIAAIAGGNGDLRCEARHRRAREHDGRAINRLDELAASLHSRVDDRKAIEHGAPGLLGFLHPCRSLGEALVARIAVRRRWNDVGEAILLDGPHELELQIERAEAAARLSKALALCRRPPHCIGKVAMRRQCLVKRDRLVEVHVGPRRPAREILPAHVAELIPWTGRGAQRRGRFLTLQWLRHGLARRGIPDC